MTVGAPTPRQLSLIALGQELTPAKSMQRVDAATARVVATVSVVGTLLTGVGLVAAGAGNLTTPARVLAAGSVLLAVISVVMALFAQTLTITRDLDTDNLIEVEKWYTKWFDDRAPRIRTATILQALAAALAGAAALLTLATSTPDPTFSVSRTVDPKTSISALTVDVTFRGMDADDVATATVKVNGAIAAEAAFGPKADGTATQSLKVGKIAVGQTVDVEARGPGVVCKSTVQPETATEANCAR